MVQESKKGALTVDTLHDAMWLFIVVPFVSFICGSCNAFSLCIFNLVHWDRLLLVWPSWVLGDLSAILCVAPCVLHLWNILHPDMLPILGQPRKSRARVELDEESQHNIESDSSSPPSKVAVGGELQSLHSGASLLPWKTSETSGSKNGAVNCEFFSDADLLDRDEEIDLETGTEKLRSPAVKRTFQDRLEVWKACWNKWVLERRRRLCVGERSGSLLMVEASSFSSTEEGLISVRRSLPRSSFYFHFSLDNVFLCS